MNVDRRWWRASVGRIRVLAAGLALLGAGYAVLGWGARVHHNARVAAQLSAMEGPSAGSGLRNRELGIGILSPAS